MQIKKLLALFLALALAVGLVGCGVESDNGERPPDTPSVPPSGAVISETEGGVNGESGVEETVAETSKAEQPSETVTDAEIVTGVEEPTIEPPKRPEGEFDFDDAMQNIYLNGRTITLPCTLKDLGEDNTFGKDASYVTDNKEVSVSIIMGDGNRLGLAKLVGCTIENFNEKSVIIGLTLNNLTSSASREIGFYGINFLGEKIKREEILKFFGNEMQGDINGNSFVYRKSEKQRIIIIFSGDTITNLSINNFKEEN